MNFYSQIDIQGICGNWQSGYYVLKIENNWVVVTKPYEVVNGSNKVTLLTMPVAFPMSHVRPSQESSKLKVFGCYKADNFLQEYGQKMSEWHGIRYASV